jgi:hypothetical protein
VSAYGNVNATIDGDIQGQVAVGNHIYQFNVNGGVVNVAPPGVEPNYQRRKSPVNIRPRPFPSLLDRDDEVAAVKSALQATVPVSLFGPGGTGKTSLLRSLAHTPELDTFPDGVVYRRVAGLGLEDVLQDLFDAFHESPSNFKPTNSEIRIALDGVKALIILDDLSLNRDEVVALLDAVPGCAFIIASLEQNLWGEGRILSLTGLPVKESLELFGRELGRSLNEQEQAEVREICVKLGGHPLQILQSASLVRENSATLSEIRAKLQQDEPEGAVVGASLKSSTDEQKSLVAILAAAGGVAVPVEHLRALSQSDTVVKDLRGLASLGLVQEEGSAFRLTGELSGTISKLWDLTAWEDRLIEFLADWLLKKPAKKLLDESIDVLVSSIQKAGKKNRWGEVVSIGRGLERTLILWRRWQTWLDILKLILKAARALGDRKVEAWTLHQMGTRAACLGFGESARGFLTGALQIRQAIGDQAGLAVTQNNLNVFFNIPIPPQPGQAQSGCRRWVTCGAAGAGGVVVLGAIVAVLIFLFPPTPPPEPEQPMITEVVLSATPIPATVTDIPTVTPTRTATATSTITPTPNPVVEIMVDNLSSLERVILYQGLKQDVFRVPVNIQISNLSNIKIEDVVVTFFYESSQGVRQIEFLPSGEDAHVGDVEIASINSGRTESFTGYMIIPRSADGETVNLLVSLEQCDSLWECEFIFDRVSLPEIIYDFIDRAPDAKWIGYEPGTDTEYDLNFNDPSPDPDQGTVGFLQNQILEDGSRPIIVLSTIPALSSEGEIEGLHLSFGENSSIFLNESDRLVTRLGFAKGPISDNVRIRVRCFPPGLSDIIVLQTINDTTDGRLVDSVFVFGDSMECSVMDFLIKSGESVGQDQVVWVAAYIERR